MTTTTFVDNVTTVYASWLNDVNTKTYTETTNVMQYGAVADGVTDCTAAFNTALATGKMVAIPDGAYYINGVVTVPIGGGFTGFHNFSDLVSKNSAVNVNSYGAVFVMGPSGQFVLNANADVSKAVIYYPTQNYNIVTDVGQPDGLSAFVTFPPTFLVNTISGAPYIHDFVYAGGTTIVQSPNTSNCEKMKIANITGCATGLAFDIQKSTDTIMFENIHLNPNTVMRQISNAGGTFANFATKLAKNAISYRFSNNDGVHLNSVFTFGTKNFIELVSTGASISMVNSASDICHTFIYINAPAKPFGVLVSNCWTTPNVYNAVNSGVVTTRTPAVIYFDTLGSSQVVEMSNFRSFGSGVGFVTDSAQITTPFQTVAGSVNLNTLTLSNTSHREVLGSISSGISFLDIYQNTTVLKTKNTFVNGLPWGEVPNELLDGWGEDNGAGWEQTGVNSLNPNLAIDRGGLRAQITSGGNIKNYAPYFQQPNIIKSFYLSQIEDYSSNLANVSVAIDILDSSRAFISNIFTGPIKTYNLKTDLIIPANVTAVNRILRITITNNDAATADFSFVSGFAGNCPFPAVAPSPYRAIADMFVSAGNADITSTAKAKICNILYNSPISANRAVTGNTVNPSKGDIVFVTRGSGATGAFTVDVGGFKSLAVSQWCSMVYSGSGWVLQSFGSL